MAAQGSLILVETGLELRFQWNPEHLLRGGRDPVIRDVAQEGHLVASEWTGREPMTIEFTLRLEDMPNGSVHDQVDRLERMAGIHRTNEPPPKLRLRYSGFARRLLVVERLRWSDDELRRADLAIVRIDATIRLREWVDPDEDLMPAERNNSRSGRVHTVVAGETLWMLATRYLDDGARWPEIAQINSVRDPQTVQPGRRLRIPQR